MNGRQFVHFHSFFESVNTSLLSLYCVMGAVLKPYNGFPDLKSSLPKELKESKSGNHPIKLFQNV